MVREILKIYTDNGLGNNNPTFKGIELSEYNAKFSRMGMPELTATLMWGTCLDNEWTGKEYVILRGEKFFINDTPHSEKSNTDARWKHEIEFTSEFARVLGGTYFEDYVPDSNSGITVQTSNKPCSNSSKFTFYGTIAEFVDRLNCAFLKAGIGDSKLNSKTNLSTLDTVSGDGYCVMLDPYGAADMYDPNKSYEFSFEGKYLWEAITYGYETTEIPFERRGRVFIFGAIPKVVSHKFEYGHDNELLSIKHRNAKAKVINRITMLGSTENIPHYYPNETEYGHISIAAKSGNKVLTAGNVQIANMTQLLSRLNADSFAVLGKYDGIDVGDAKAEVDAYTSAFDDASFTQYNVGTYLTHNPVGNRQTTIPWHIRVFFKVKKEGVVECKDVRGHVWVQNNAPTDDGVNMIENIKPEKLITVEDQSQGINSVDYSSQIDKHEGKVSLGRLPVGSYIFQFAVNIPNKGGNDNPITAQCYLKSVTIGAADKQKTGYYWDVDGKKYDGVGALGVKITLNISDTMIGDGFGWTASGRMPFQDHLIPPKYRETLGAERFYNAINGTYTDPDTNQKYVFPNPFVGGKPSEHIFRDGDRKPTIEGVTNASGQLMGVIADIAYDLNDNDVLKPDSSEDGDKNDALKYEHSFFYIKLNVFNGTYGFDLFAHASQTDAMTIQMRDGSCNGCKFKIQAVKFTDETGLETYKNPIVVRNDKAVGVVSEDGIKESDLDPTQQNTQTHSIWICVQKDAETFGVLMPNQSNGFKPQIGDKFNITNIVMPLSYWYAAEKRLEDDGIRCMADNNEEKFTFDIQASRIFFAENPNVLAQLDEYSVIKVKYNGKTYEQYVNQLTIDCKDSEALPNIGIDLTDTLAVGQSFIEQVAERASSLIANPYTMGGALGSGGGGLTTRLADMRYLKKTEADRSKGKIASDIGFEVGEFVSGASGGIFFRDPETGQTYIEVDKIKARMKAIFAELEVAKEQSIGGKFDITPGGGIDISFVEELTNSYRCYFKAKDEDKGAECRFVVGDQARCQESNISAGTMQNASNRYYWRLVTVVNNDESYIELSKTDCDTGSDVPIAGDTVVQLGNRDNPERQSAIILSTVDAFAPCVTLYNGIDHYSLDGKSVVEYGVDKTQDPPEPFFNCYGRMYVGPRDRSSFIEFNPSDKSLIFKGRISVLSSLGDDNIGDYIDNAAQDAADKAKMELQSKITELQNQIDGVVETWSGGVDPTKLNYPADDWDTENERQNHIGDVYFNIGAYDPDSNPNAGGAWRWYYDSPTDYGWIRIADSDAVRALQLAQMSVLDTDVLYKQTTSQTDPPVLPTVSTSGVITNFNGWSTNAPAWEDGKYIWQCTYVKKGDGSAAFAGPTCISGKDGEDGNGIDHIEEEYYLSTSATQLIGDTWHTEADKPTWVAGKYMWTRTHVYYTDGTDATFGEVCVTGATGASVLAEYSADGVSWHPSFMAGDEWMRTSSDGGNTWTSAIKIVGTAGADGKWRKFQWAKNTSTTTAPTSGWQDTPMTAPAGEYVWMRSGIVVPPATNPTVWETATRITGDKGASGADVYFLDLSNEMMGVICDADGNVTGSYETSQASVWKGLAQVASGITYSIAQTDGISATIAANGLITVSGLTKDNATIVVQAVVDGVTLQSTISVYKVKSGADGDPAVVYSIEPEVDNITVALDGTLSVTTLKVWIYKTTGDSARQPTNEKILKYQRIGEDTTQATATISNATTGASIAVTSNTTAIILTLYDTNGTTILDRERVPFVTDGKEIADEWAKVDERLSEMLVDLDGLGYLRRALRDGATVFEGGLLLSTLIKLGLWDKTNAESPILTKVYAGMNGMVPYNKPESQLSAAEKLANDRTIASWWGGDMVDRFNSSNVAISPVPTNAASALVRMDGSAYFSKGNIGFRADGGGWLGHQTNGILFEPNGSMTFGSGIKISSTSGDKTLESLINFMVGLGNVFIPENASNQQVDWDSTALDHVRAKKGFCSDSFISAKGLNSNGSAGGGATQLRMLTDVQINDSTLESGQALVYDGTHWVNQTIDTVLGEYLAVNDYARKSDLSPYLKTDGSNGTAAGLSALVRKLSEASGDVTDITLLVTSDNAGDGGSSQYYRRPASKLWSYVKGKADTVYQPIGSYYTKTEADGRFLGISANAASATKLSDDSSFTAWGQEFFADGKPKTVSGDMTGVGSINTYLASISGSGNARLNISGVTATTDYIHLYVDGSGSNTRPLVLQDGYGYVGVGTSTPAYKLDVAGSIHTTDALFFANGKISGVSETYLQVLKGTAAHGLAAGGLLVSNSYSDYSKVPTNGIYVKGEVISASYNSYRIAYGNYGFFLRNDGSYSYFLLTASGDQYGSFNSLRPLFINNSTGLVTMQNGLKVNSVTIGDCEITWDSSKGGLHFSKGIYSDGYVTAHGAGSSSGGSGGGAFALYTKWSDTPDASDALSGILGKELHTRLSAIEGKTLVQISGDGVMEIGKYIDFHTAGFGTNTAEDLAARISIGSGTGREFILPESGGTLATQGWVTGKGYLTSLPTRLAQYITPALSDGNGFGRIASGSPFVSFVGASSSDCMLITTAYSDAWRGELALDYRSNNMAYRNKNNGTWNDWALVLTNKNIGSYAITSHQSLANYVTLNGDQTVVGSKTHTGYIKMENALFFKNTDRANGIYVSMAADADAIRVYHHNNYTYQKKIVDLDTDGNMELRGQLKIVTNSKYVTINCQNSSFTHYSTDASSGHWFNKDVYVQGNIYAGSGYNQLVWHQGNDGSGSGLDADLLDGHHAGSALMQIPIWRDLGHYADVNNRDTNDTSNMKNFLRRITGSSQYGSKLGGTAFIGTMTPNSQSTIIGRAYSDVAHTDGMPQYSYFIKENLNGRVYTFGTNEGVYYEHTLAFLTDNVASATKLANTHTIWGQNFNGTGNVSGNMTDVGTIKGTASVAPYLLQSAIPTDAGNLGTAIGLGGTSASYGTFIWGDGSGKGHIQVGRKDGTVSTYSLILQEFGGNVGIGTTSPSERLTVNGWVGTIGNTGWYSITHGGGWYMTDTTWIRGYNGKSLYMGTGTIRTDGALHVGNAGARFLVDSSGDVGIGTTSPKSGHAHFRKAILAAKVALKFTDSTDGSGDGMYFQSGVDEPYLSLYKHTNGSWAASTFRFYHNGSFWASTGIWSNGYVSAKGQNTSSDARLKNIVKALSLDIRDIANAPSVEFTWRDDGKSDIGSVAQYWQGIDQRLTPLSHDGWLTLQYGKTALLASISIAKKVMSHDEEIRELRAEVKRLNDKIRQLEMK